MLCSVTKKLKQKAKINAGKEKKINLNIINNIIFFLELPTSLKTPNSNEFVSVVINNKECISIKLKPKIPNKTIFKIKFNNVIPYLYLFIVLIKGISTL